MKVVTVAHLVPQADTWFLMYSEYLQQSGGSETDLKSRSNLRVYVHFAVFFCCGSGIRISDYGISF